MRFGLQFFPDVRPNQKSGADYFRDALSLVEDSEELGFSHIRIVEHYFHYYGGGNPKPPLFFAAPPPPTPPPPRGARGEVPRLFLPPQPDGRNTTRARRAGLRDATHGKRLEAGFARAFLRYDSPAFARSRDESVARFREGPDQVEPLLTEQNVTHRGRFHTIENTTSLPRPTQKPRP